MRVRAAHPRRSPPPAQNAAQSLTPGLQSHGSGLEKNRDQERGFARRLVRKSFGQPQGNAVFADNGAGLRIETLPIPLVLSFLPTRAPNQRPRRAAILGLFIVCLYSAAWRFQMGTRPLRGLYKYPRFQAAARQSQVRRRFGVDRLDLLVVFFLRPLGQHSLGRRQRPNDRFSAPHLTLANQLTAHPLMGLQSVPRSG